MLGVFCVELTLGVFVHHARAPFVDNVMRIMSSPLNFVVFLSIATVATEQHAQAGCIVAIDGGQLLLFRQIQIELSRKEMTLAIYNLTSRI